MLLSRLEVAGTLSVRGAFLFPPNVSNVVSLMLSKVIEGLNVADL
jgi:hypothetical protein